MAEELAERFVVHVNLPSFRRASSIAGKNGDMKAAFSLGVACPGYRPIRSIGNDALTELADSSARRIQQEDRPRTAAPAT
ncbi:hypothetical protein GCM10010435_29960 [Winogradskya consettensis]|uniref:Uncharacterized protein n=1 Tax=Winogradskya consettensis TaxID=113560 RepID=A0A919VV93_9ACTN|nr:hypothetical protein Aco04nite_21540 [Actinoplanes consettensis]